MMDYSLTVYNAASDTKFEYAPAVRKVQLSTNRNCSAGKLTFSYVGKEPYNTAEGAKVTFSVKGTPLFEGYIFTRETDRYGVNDITAYDQLRYLKANASYSFTGKTAGDIIVRMASDFRLRTGIIEDTGYAIPSLTKEDTGCLDIISYALQQTQNSTGRTYVFFDDAGSLSLREARNMMSMTLVGDGSLLTGYKYKSDIDRDTYNQIKLVRPNKETGKADTYIFRDEGTIRRWGLLQLYEKVDENMNSAQITQRGQVMMAYYDRVLKTVSVDCIGVPGVRVGSMVNFRVSDIPELSGGYWLLADKATHEFTSVGHTMSLEAKILTL